MSGDPSSRTDLANAIALNSFGLRAQNPGRLTESTKSANPASTSPLPINSAAFARNALTGAGNTVRALPSSPGLATAPPGSASTNDFTNSGYLTAR